MKENNFCKINDISLYYRYYMFVSNFRRFVTNFPINNANNSNNKNNVNNGKICGYAEIVENY